MSNVVPLGDPHLHFWLTRSMARCARVNLSDALHDGALEASQYAEMVTKCRQCPHVAACQAWLAQPSQEMRDLPDFCVNRPVLESLQMR